MVANIKDLVGVGVDFIMIESIESLSEPSEMSDRRDIEAKNQNYGSKVFDENSFYLGR
jgi:hypothetical protein